MQKINVFWFRRDLRLQDNSALYYALKAGLPVLPLFIFDKNILDKLDDQKDKRVTFLHQTIVALNHELEKSGTAVYVLHETPQNAFKKILGEFSIGTVFANHDYEPYAKERDEKIQKLLNSENVAFITEKDQVIFEKGEVTKDDTSPYTVFTPYSKKWKAKLNEFYLKPYPTEKYGENLFKWSGHQIPSLKKMGFEEVDFSFPPHQTSRETLVHYDKCRDFPAQRGTSHLGIHLRFGTISIRKLAQEAVELNGTFLNELIWRDFYQMILWHFPHVVEYSFKADYDQIKWRNNEDEFEAWCQGKTGYPLVDAGMRELNETGYMHNRVRMVTASFLCKHLLIDWRWGEAYFGKKLLDYDLAANNGGWQWTAGTGTDAAPYFRVFNPTLQANKFDPQQVYIKKWVPEFQDVSYKPIVTHEFARERCLKAYKKALNA